MREFLDPVTFIESGEPKLSDTELATLDLEAMLHSEFAPPLHTELVFFSLDITNGHTAEDKKIIRDSISSIVKESHVGITGFLSMPPVQDPECPHTEIDRRALAVLFHPHDQEKMVVWRRLRVDKAEELSESKEVVIEYTLSTVSDHVFDYLLDEMADLKESEIAVHAAEIFGSN